MVRPFIGRPVRVEVHASHIQGERFGTLEEVDEYGIRLDPKNDRQEEFFLAWPVISLITPQLDNAQEGRGVDDG
jgi:hypothetical protein